MGSHEMQKESFEEKQIRELKQTNAKLVEENDKLVKTTSWHISEQDQLIFELQSELSKANERIKEFEDVCKRALNYVNDDLSIHIELNNLLTPKQHEQYYRTNSK